MVKGVSIKFQSYQETIPKLLKVIKFEKELQKHKKIVLKPSLRNLNTRNTSVSFTEAVLSYCIQHKDPDAQIFIAEGSDGEETTDMFDKLGYRDLAEKYSVSLIDLNTSEVEEIRDGEFLRFENIYFPKLLLESFIISLPVLCEDEELEIYGALANMLGAFPAQYYRGFFSQAKNKIRKHPLKFAIHDILICKMPEFAIIDSSEKGVILAGLPLDMDIQSAKLLGKEDNSVSHIRLVGESFANKPQDKKEVSQK